MNKIFFFLVFISGFGGVLGHKIYAQDQGIYIHKKVLLQGEFESEFIHSQYDARLVTNTASTTNDDNAIPRFQVDRLMLKPKITLVEDVYLEGELEFFGDGTNTLLKEAYGVVKLPGNIFIKVGLDDRFFINPEERGTEIYPLNGTAFWRDEDVGITVGGDHPWGHKTSFYWRTAVTNGLALREHGVGKNNVYFMLHDNRQIDDLTKGGKEVSGGLGLKYQGTELSWDALGFGSWAELRIGMSATQTVTDVDFLREVITGYTSKATKTIGLGGGSLISI